jgi:hypothetical protein
VNKSLASLLQKATKGRAETTIVELFEIFELDPSNDLLSKVLLVKANLANLGLGLVPEIDHGDLASARCVGIVESPALTETDILKDLSDEESNELERKSSLLYDHRRARNDSNVTTQQLRSDAVLHSVMRAIAGFLNTGGGVLYLGVDDRGAVVGIEFDFPYVSGKSENQNADHWELYLRSQIESCFKEGRIISDYVSCKFLLIDSKRIARLGIHPRSKLSFLSFDKTFHLYRRQGNRTVEVTVDLFEEFVEFRKSLQF